LPAILSDSAWCEALLSDADVLIQPGFLYDFEGEAWVVLSLLPEESVFEQAVHRLGEHVEAAVRGAMP
jgi:aspartate/methionine/tyrosine aminotransferase